MTDEKTAVDPIAELTQHYLDRIATAQPTVKSQLETVVACKFTHRQHTVNNKALWPARQFLALKETLPKALWMSSAGAYLVEGLEQLAELEHAVFNIRCATTFLEGDRAVVLSLDPENAQMAKAAQKIQSLAAPLNGQLLVAERREIINSLRALLSDTDPSVADVREALRDRLVGFIEHQIDLAAHEAGYHTLHPHQEMGAASMLATAESLIKQMWTLAFTFKPSKPNSQSVRFGEQLEPGGQSQEEAPRQIGQVDGKAELQTRLTNSDRALIALNLNRALSLGTVAISELVEDYATLRADSTVRGRMDLLSECVFALEPQSPAQGSDDAVAYRMKYGHERMNKSVRERTEQFVRDLQRATDGLDRASKIIYEVVGLNRAFKESTRR